MNVGLDLRRLFHVSLLVFGANCTVCTPLLAGELIYTPINPSFGGNPLNSSHLFGLANAQDLPKAKADEEAAAKQAASKTTQSMSQQFIQMLEGQLYSSLANQISQAIFGPNAQKQGTIKFQDQQVSFLNTGTQIQLTITDFTTGQVTQIVVPTLVTTK